MRALTVIDGRGTDVIAFSRTRVEEAGMDMTALGSEVSVSVDRVWSAVNRGDFAMVGQVLARLDATARRLTEIGAAMSGDAANADAFCPDGEVGPAHGKAA